MAQQHTIAPYTVANVQHATAVRAATLAHEKTVQRVTAWIDERWNTTMQTWERSPAGQDSLRHAKNTARQSLTPPDTDRQDFRMHPGNVYAGWYKDALVPAPEHILLKQAVQESVISSTVVRRYEKEADLSPDDRDPTMFHAVVPRCAGEEAAAGVMRRFERVQGHEKSRARAGQTDRQHGQAQDHGMERYADEGRQ